MNGYINTDIHTRKKPTQELDSVFIIHGLIQIITVSIRSRDAIHFMIRHLRSQVDIQTKKMPGGARSRRGIGGWRIPEIQSLLHNRQDTIVFYLAGHTLAPRTEFCVLTIPESKNCIAHEGILRDEIVDRLIVSLPQALLDDHLGGMFPLPIPVQIEPSAENPPPHRIHDDSVHHTRNRGGKGHDAVFVVVPIIHIVPLGIGRLLSVLLAVGREIRCPQKYAVRDWMTGSVGQQGKIMKIHIVRCIAKIIVTGFCDANPVVFHFTRQATGLIITQGFVHTHKPESRIRFTGRGLQGHPNVHIIPSVEQYFSVQDFFTGICPTVVDIKVDPGTEIPLV